MDDKTGPNVLKMLFARGLPVNPDRARAVFRPINIDTLVKAGLLIEEEEGGVKARFQAQPYGGLIFFSDFIQWVDAADFVLPIGPASHYLALLTVRGDNDGKRTDSTLDLGCGCGIQALLAAQHSASVTATDINPRALALTRFNAALNGIQNVETLQGSYMAPIRDRRFDLIVGNLPYVISPAAQFPYRDADLPGDSGIYRWLEHVPSHLNEGGMAQVLINWIRGEGQDWSEPIREALSGRGVDAWLIHNGSKEPDEYADKWIDQRTRQNGRQFRLTKQAWLKWYKAHGIARIALGALVLRRRSSKENWFEAAEVRTSLRDSAGEQFRRLFAMRDWLGALDSPNAMLQERLVRADVVISIDSQTGETMAAATKGLRLEHRMSPATAAAFGQLDGSTDLETIIRRTGARPEFVGEDVLSEVLEDMSALMRLGMVVPGETPE